MNANATRRAQRRAEGKAARATERKTFASAGRRAPTHKQMILPLLEELQARGGGARPIDIYDAVASRLGVSSGVRAEMATVDGRVVNLWERHVRWARQTAVYLDLLSKDQRGVWKLAEAGKNLLGNIRHGIIVTVFETDAGVCLWSTAETAAAMIKPESVDLVFTSPMYPMLSDKRGYGTMDPASWLDWMTDLGHAWKGLLKPTGSMMIHLGDAWYRGVPTQSPYIERFVIRMLDKVGLHLAQRLYADNLTRLPAPRPWVAIKRVRVKPSIDPVLWFSKGTNPKADNRAVLAPYKPSTQRWLRGRGNGKMNRPSGHVIDQDAFAVDNGGAIPGNSIRCTGQDSDVQRYRRACKAAGLPKHPAIMPREIAEFGIKLTTEAGNLVYDPFFGSGTTGDVAEKLGRQWIGSERSLAYARGAALRFPGVVA